MSLTPHDFPIGTNFYIHDKGDVKIPVAHYQNGTGGSWCGGKFTPWSYQYFFSILTRPCERLVPVSFEEFNLLVSASSQR